MRSARSRTNLYIVGCNLSSGSAAGKTCPNNKCWKMLLVKKTDWTMKETASLKKFNRKGSESSDSTVRYKFNA